jgi:hypothetical protein
LFTELLTRSELDEDDETFLKYNSNFKQLYIFQNYVSVICIYIYTELGVCLVKVFPLIDEGLPK